MKFGLFITIGLMFMGCAGSVSQITGEEETVKTKKVRIQTETKPSMVPQNKGRATTAPAIKSDTAVPIASSTIQTSGATDVQDAIDAEKNGNLDKAESILSASSSNPAVKCDLAIIKYRKGMYGDASRLARDAVQSMKTDSCLKVAFNAGIAQHDFNGLANFLSTYVASHPKSITAANFAARVLIFQGKPSEAVRRAKQVLKRAETNIDVMKTLAMAYMVMKRYDATRFVIAQIREIKKDDADSMDMMGHILLNTGKKRAAILMFSDAVKADPGLYDAWINLGLLNLDAGDYDDAETEFKTAIKLMPGRVEGYIDLGTLLTKTVKFSEARKVLHKGLEVSPNNALIYFNLGIIELSDKPADIDRPEHYRKAIVWFKKYQENTSYISSSDAVYKYMDEAKRMAQQQELLMQQMQQTPKAPAQPAPEKKAEPKPAAQPPDATPVPKPATDTQGTTPANTGGKK